MRAGGVPVSKCCGYEVHPAAELFPMMPEKELQELADDIKKNGLIQSIVLYEKKVLDGRNRIVACEMADVIPYFRNYQGEHSPTEYVLATNLKRRQLTTSQRAAIAVEALPMLEAEAKRRQALKVNLPEVSKGQARDKAASAVSVSPRYVQDAKKLKAEAPEVFQKVATGHSTISAAKKVLGWGRNPHPEPDSLSILKAVWSRCNKQQQSAFLKWVQKHR